MTRARLAALAGVAALAGCGGSSASAPALALAQPSSVAVFRGITSADPAIQPYFATANALRNDLTLLNANTDSAVLAPVQLRPLAVPTGFRPTLVVSASLGDDKPDLLVAVAGDSGSSGSSSLQLVRTWDAVNEVVEERPVEGEVLAAVAVPSGTQGTARIALALSDKRIALVDYVRSGTDAIAWSAMTVSDPLAIQPVSLAAMPGDPMHLYAATPDEFAPGEYGVADISVSGMTFSVSRIDARGPTRLVAAATLMERADRSAASDTSAFAGQNAVQRVYAVLDESGCGTSGRIDCGIAVLDPATGTIRSDVSGRMPYLAPISLPSRPLAIAVSPPPAAAPPEDAADKAPFMRLWPATGPLATTAVAAVPCEDGKVYFLDLGRWKLANDKNAVVNTTAMVTIASAPTAVQGGTVRLSLEDLGAGAEILAANADAATATPKYVEITPGYTRDATFGVAFQGALPSLTGRRAEAGLAAAGQPWLAMQVTAGSAAGQVVRLWDPSLGVQVGDTVQLDAAAVPAGTPACVGTVAPGADAASRKIFEARVAALLPPSAPYPGGAVQLARKEAADVPLPLPSGTASQGEVVDLWGTCFDRLAAAAAAGVVPSLTASILAGGYLVTRNGVEYVGRTDTSAPFTLEYPSASGGEDALPACPLIPWPARLDAMACDATCRSACDDLLLARRARRFYHVAESCAGDAACEARFPPTASPGSAFPDVAGPVVKFQIALDGLDASGNRIVDPPAARGLSLSIGTASGVSSFAAPASGTANLGSLTHPNDVVAFDRSQHDPGSGYRFVVPYVGNWMLDTSPSVQSAASVVIR